MRFLDLFSGIGGFSIGLERAGMTCVGHVEKEPFCQKVLKKHWPDVPLISDIHEVKGDEFGSVDLVCGSPPCQPFSSASRGRSRGTEDDRWLWTPMFRIVQHLEPGWVLVENVTGFDGLALEEVVSDLETSNYEVAPPLEIPACAVGFPHRRSRLWVCAHSNRNSKSNLPLYDETPGSTIEPKSVRKPLGGVDGVSSRLDGSRERLKALGNAVVPAVVEEIGRAILRTAESP